jgi:hypothetical protein
MQINKSKVRLLFCAVGAVGAGLLGIQATASALEPGVFTQCVAWNNGITYAILGAGYRDRCFQLARECSGNPNVQATWYGSAVLVQTPYTQCRPR